MLIVFLLFFFSESDHGYDVIVFDVDSKDTSVGMSSPPQAFVDRPFLTRVHSLLCPSGQLSENVRHEHKLTNFRRIFQDFKAISCSL